MSFVERGHPVVCPAGNRRASGNVIVLGPPGVGTPAPGAGVGETHLAIALGIKAVEAGYSVLFLTLEQLIARLGRAAKENRLERSLQQLTYPKVLTLAPRLPAAQVQVSSTRSATCPSPASRPVCSSVWSCAGMSGPA